MIDVDLKISVQYRSDGHISPGAVYASVCEAILAAHPATVFTIENAATYAGYAISIEPKTKRPRS